MCELHCPFSASRLTYSKPTIRITTDDYSEFEAKAIILALGVAWRRIDVDGIGRYMNRGVFYGTPPEVYHEPKGNNVVILGAANSAAQAALDIAKDPDKTVTVLARTTLAKNTSAYLVDRIKAMANIAVWEGCQLREARGGDGRLEYVNVQHDSGDISKLAADYLLIYIGGSPSTLWLEGTGVSMDKRHFILTDQDIHGSFPDRPFLSHETAVPGVFAIGDVTFGPTKRIAKAVGDGADAVASIHRYLAL